MCKDICIMLYCLIIDCIFLYLLFVKKNVHYVLVTFFFALRGEV